MAEVVPATKGWRTTLWNVGVVGAGAVVTYLATHTDQIAAVIPTQYVGIAAIIMGTINQLFRNMTTTPVGVK